MDLLDICNAFGINPLHAAIAKIDQSLLATQDDVVDLAKAAKAIRVHQMYNINGSVKDEVLLEILTLYS